MPAESLRALLSGAIDYAGLFPPATLPLEEAMANYSRYVRDDDNWMLGPFVLPVGCFAELGPILAPFDVLCRLHISVLGPKTETAPEFLAVLRNAAQALREFHTRYGAIAGATQIEMALPSQPGASMSEARDALATLQLPTFWEAPADDAERVIATLTEHRRATASEHFGLKLRTGGVIASAFPSSIQIARALVAATKYRVPIKFTAGLHHPIRKFHPSVQMKMHGFLNVLGAGVLTAEHGWSVQQTAAMLDDEDAASFACDEASFSWRDWKVATERIREHRAVVTSFGSCSFDEPREDLRALGLL